MDMEFEIDALQLFQGDEASLAYEDPTKGMCTFSCNIASCKVSCALSCLVTS